MTQSNLLEALQQTSQRLAADLVDKTNQIDLLNSKLRTFNEDHAEEVQASRFQVMEQDKVIKALQAEAQQLKSRLSPLRRDAACQPPPTPPPNHFACQAAPTTAEAALQAQPEPGCNAASQTEPANAPRMAVGVGVGGNVAGGEQNGDSMGSAAVLSQGTQTEVAMEGVQGEKGLGGCVDAKLRNAGDAALAVGRVGAPKGGGNDAQKVEASDAHPSRDTLAFDLQVLTKKYERAINQKVEAEEASLQAQLDVAQLIKLCEFYKSKAEAAVQASLQQHKAQVSSGKGSQQDHGTQAQQQNHKRSIAQAPQQQQQQIPYSNIAQAKQQQQQQQQPHSNGAPALPHQQPQGSGAQTWQQPQSVGAHAHPQLGGCGAQAQQQPLGSGAHSQQHRAHTYAAPVAAQVHTQQQQQQQQQPASTPSLAQGETQLLYSNHSTRALQHPAQDLASSASAQGGPLYPPPHACGVQDGMKNLQGSGWHGAQGSAASAHDRGVLESSASDLQGGRRMDAHHGVSPGACTPPANMQNSCVGALQGNVDVQGWAGGGSGESYGGSPLDSH